MSNLLEQTLKKAAHTVYTPCMSVDEEVAARTNPAVSTIWWNILRFLWDMTRSSLQLNFSGGARTVMLCSIW